jgi:hypothetical protein
VCEDDLVEQLDDARLIVSDRALEFLQRAGIEHAEQERFAR